MDTVELFDRVPITGARRDAAGNLVVNATVARTGIYEYAGFELNRPEMRRVRVYRPPEEVFNRDSLRSLAAVPVTINHPREMVTPDNWRDHAKGETSSDDIVRDGEAVKVPFILRDEAGIKSIEDGKHELSPGYTAVIDWAAGQTEAGDAYDAVARNIRYNHLAIVDKARGGSSCRIGDEKPREKKVDTKTILVDGLNVEVTDDAERAIIKLQDAVKAATTERDEFRTKLTDAEKERDTVKGEKVALEQQLKDARDPAALQKAADARAKLCTQAKAIVSNIVTDGKDDAIIRKEVVDAKLGDAAKDFNEEQIAGAFATLASTVKVSSSTDKVADALRNRTTSVTDEDVSGLLENRQKALDARSNRYSTAYLGVSDKE